MAPRTAIALFCCALLGVHCALAQLAPAAPAAELLAPAAEAPAAEAPAAEAPAAELTAAAGPATTTAAAATTPDLGAIPPACLNFGSSLQTECAATFSEAQAFFKIAPGQIPPPGSISQKDIEAYLASAQPPSAQCCKLACEFNNAFCSCEKAVVDFAASLAGNAEVYQTVGAAFARACKFRGFIGATCPAPALRPTTPKDACAP